MCSYRVLIFLSYTYNAWARGLKLLKAYFAFSGFEWTILALGSIVVLLVFVVKLLYGLYKEI